ncbi:MAG TPA: hypothetical protein VFY29_02540 [Terriglobia bacterium]|nr:hypothetical protein [Terriglobia bacterium]
MGRRQDGVSRRTLLKDGVATAALSGLLTPALSAVAQGPAVVTRRRFRAWISRGDGPGRTTLQEATLRPISGRQVVVRTEVTNLCYSNGPAVLGQAVNPGAATAPRSVLAASGARRMNDMAVIQGHGGVRHRRSRRAGGAPRSGR